MSRLLTTAEAAARIGRAPKTLRNWRVSRAVIPYVTSGGRFAGYREADIETYIAGLTAVEVA